MREIETLCKESGLDKQLRCFMTEAEAGVTRLLAAFFFRNSGHNEGGDKTFVFTHKSFGEYLTVCRIVRAMEKIHGHIKRRDADPEDGWSERRALKHWAQICGPSAISPYMHTFLLNEVLLRPIEEVQSWQGCFTGLFNHALTHGLPMESLGAGRVCTFTKMLFQSRNAEEALIVVLNACACVTPRVSAIEHPTPEAFGTWFKRIKGQLKRFENVLAAKCLSFLNLSGVNLILADLTNVNLAGSNLTNADLTDAHLNSACLRGAILTEADFTDADMSNAQLNGATMTKANLTGANLTGVNLTGVNLREANLRDADLTRANLSNADLTDADLRGADLTDVHLIDANLRYADLTNANLTGVNLRDANR
ncbi:MAG: pentapeptide repeat-containing protein [Magnetococcales bacterium]|nr:pentapeptide repeat-containing protein [Nitrospirota bacterium]